MTLKATLLLQTYFFLSSLKSWPVSLISSHQLKFSMAKTELFVVPPPNPSSLLPFLITGDNISILPVTQACNLGVLFDSELFLGPPIQAVSKGLSMPTVRPGQAGVWLYSTLACCGLSVLVHTTTACSQFVRMLRSSPPSNRTRSKGSKELLNYVSSMHPGSEAGQCQVDLQPSLLKSSSCR